MHLIRKHVVEKDVIFHIGTKRYINLSPHISNRLFRGTTLMGPNITIPLPLSVLFYFSGDYCILRRFPVSGYQFLALSLD